MKNLYILTFIVFTSLSCKAQTPIIDIEERPTIWDTPTINAYYKDINNFYNGFEGTWVGTRGNKTLKIVLKKEEKIPNDVPYYADYVFGEYLYSENGIEKINTLNNSERFNRGITGSYLLKSSHKPTCNDCDPNKRRLEIGFFDRVHKVSATLYLQHTTVNGQPALKGLMYGDGGSYNAANPPEHLYMVIPTGWWTFVKE
ncbi:DUF6705 family protein [Tenacibaculum ascidiaceicola]|uniref:DUF6705 family protein n=1 Tax=Tenacibaculum ascidiaceicola TaxID=1699411 RepID=UPI003CE54905